MIGIVPPRSKCHWIPSSSFAGNTLQSSVMTLIRRSRLNLSRARIALRGADEPQGVRTRRRRSRLPSGRLIGAGRRCCPAREQFCLRHGSGRDEFGRELVQPLLYVGIPFVAEDAAAVSEDCSAAAVFPQPLRRSTIPFFPPWGADRGYP